MDIDNKTIEKRRKEIAQKHRKDVEEQRTRLTRKTLDILAKGYNSFNPYEVGELIENIGIGNVGIARDIKQRILDEFYHLNAEDSHGYHSKERGMHSSYYAVALNIAKELGDSTKKIFFERRYHNARSHESDCEIADTMMDSMWGL